jgi:hypothetical protein
MCLHRSSGSSCQRQTVPIPFPVPQSQQVTTRHNKTWLTSTQLQLSHEDSSFTEFLYTIREVCPFRIWSQSNTSSWSELLSMDSTENIVRLKSNIAQWPQDPVCTQEITLHAIKYKLCTTGHSNQPISELFHVSYNVRRLQRIWPEDLARQFQRTIAGWYLTQDTHLTYCLLITLKKPE